VGEKFLYLAYVFAGLIYLLYAWNLSRRLVQSRKELNDLRKRLQASPPSNSLSP
jgi:hypothetical protein